MIYQGKARYPVTEVMLHCAGVATGYFHNQTPFQVFSTINKWHHERGWKNGFGYHGLFMPDGAFFAGRPFEMIGAGCIGRNNGVLHFLLIERNKVHLPAGYTLDDCRFAQWFSEAQRQAVIARIGDIPGIRRVSGHNDFAPKLCPGFRVKTEDWLNRKGAKC